MLRGEGDVVHGAGALAAVDLRRRLVVGVEAAAALAADLPALAAWPRRSRASRRAALAARRGVAVGAHALEALQRVLGGISGESARERLVLGGGDDELVLEALGVGEQQAVAGPLGRHAARRQALAPELERLAPRRRARRSGAPSPRRPRRGPRRGTRRTSGPSPASRPRRRRRGGRRSVRPG